MESIHLDRCDRCGARGQVEVEFFSGGILVFCDHHYTAFEAAMEPRVLRLRKADPSLV